MDNTETSSLLPTELNFLVYLNNIHKQKDFPYFGNYFELFDENFDLKMSLLWSEKLKTIKERKVYIHNDFNFRYADDIESFFKNNNEADLLKTKILNRFDTWWFKQAPMGNQFILESLFNISKFTNLVNQNGGYKFILVLFDEAPENCEINFEDLFNIVTIQSFLL
jgi:hypothetical protein